MPARLPTSPSSSPIPRPPHHSPALLHQAHSIFFQPSQLTAPWPDSSPKLRYSLFLCLIAHLARSRWCMCALSHGPSIDRSSESELRAHIPPSPARLRFFFLVFFKFVPLHKLRVHAPCPTPPSSALRVLLSTAPSSLPRLLTPHTLVRAAPPLSITSALRRGATFRVSFSSSAIHTAGRIFRPPISICDGVPQAPRSHPRPPTAASSPDNDLHGSARHEAPRQILPSRHPSRSRPTTWSSSTADANPHLAGATWSPGYASR
ncbi:hypothetical protein C8J57DRAFT_1722178 [Mycena rebaudengoi]|nr:hypothetical protein C8J57DRAFT_1722178 [Mycena rebaudengoi]